MKKTNNILKRLNLTLERKVLNYREENIKLKRDVASLNRQIKFYKDKLRIDLAQKRKDEKSLLNRSYFKSITRSVNKGRSLMNKSFNSNNSAYSNTLFNRKPSNNYNLNSASSYKKSGYYSRNITKQVMGSSKKNIFSKEGLNTSTPHYGYSSNLRSNSKINPNKSYISNLTEDEINLNMNSSLLGELEMMNSTYSKKYSVNNDYNYNSRVKGINNMKSNILDYKKFNSKSPLTFTRNSRSKRLKMEQFQKDFNYQSRETSNSKYGRINYNNYSTTTNNNMNMNLNMNINFSNKFGNKDKEDYYNSLLENDPVVNAKPSNKDIKPVQNFNNLKVKLSENNIKEILLKFTSTLDEEINWIEQQEKELVSFKPTSNNSVSFKDEHKNRQNQHKHANSTFTHSTNFSSSSMNVSSTPKIQGSNYNINYLNQIKQGYSGYLGHPGNKEKNEGVINLVEMKNTLESSSINLSSRSKNSIIHIPNFQKNKNFTFKPKNKIGK